MNPRDDALTRLVSLGYLKYLRSPSHQKILRQLRDSFLKWGYLETARDDDNVSLDRRSYPGDSEELAEGHIGEFLCLMKKVLAKEAVILDSAEDLFDSKGYRLRINGILHPIYEAADVNRIDIGALATRRSLETVNSLLKAANSEERLWAAWGGNDGRLMLLSEEMRAILQDKSLRVDPHWMPKGSEDLQVSTLI